MMTVSAVLQRVHGLDAATLEVWVSLEWVRPQRQAGKPVFEEIDVARLRLILDLRNTMEVGEAAMPVVLSLLDQLHATRAQIRGMAEALQQAGPEARAADVLATLSQAGSAGAGQGRR